MNAMDIIKRLEQIYRMSVWNAQGRQYLPVHGYSGEVEVYMPALDALEVWEQDFIESMNSQRN